MGDGLRSQRPWSYAGRLSYAILIDAAPDRAWGVDENTPVYLVAENPTAVREAQLALARIGRDNVAGALAGGFEAWRDAGLPFETSGIVAPRDVADCLDSYAVIDVREEGEVLEDGCIPGASPVIVGHLEEELASSASTVSARSSRPAALVTAIASRRAS